MKLLKRKNFQALIYAIFISLPMLSILPSTIYFAFNHNAQEYTQNEVVETYEYETNEVNSVDDLVEGNIYKFNIDTDYIQTLSARTLFQFTKIYHYMYVNGNNTDYNFYVDIVEDNQLFAMFKGGNNTSSELNIVIKTYNVSNLTFNWYTVYDKHINYDCYFVYDSLIDTTSNIIDYISASDYLGEKNVEVIESEMNPLTAFDNAIDKFVSENDFGKLDFFTFFSSLFLTSTSMNNLYIHFINWYMNYALYVSLAYLLFGVLLYFVNFFRKLVENSEDTHIGGF